MTEKEDETNEILDDVDTLSDSDEFEGVLVLEPKEEENLKVIKIRCSQCNSAQVYTTKTYKVCRKCGYREVLNGR